MSNFDVLVIGGGILGISHAYHAVKTGLKVALVERNPYPQEASVRNFGRIVPSGMNTKWQQLGRISLDIYQDIQKDFDISIRKQGSIYLASDNEELQLLEELAEINKGNDYPSLLLNKEKCLAAYPGLKSSYVKGGLYFPEELNVDPLMASRRIIEYCKEKYNLTYLPNTLIKNLVRANGEVIATTSAGDFIKSSKVFLCSGTEFKILYPQEFSESDLQVVKLQMLKTRPQKNQILKGSILTGWTIRRYECFHECPSFKIFENNYQPNPYQKKYGIHILFKQNEDGSIIIGDSHEYFSVQNKIPVTFDHDWAINQYMLTEAAKIFDFENNQLHATWNGYYSQCSNQDIFQKIIDEHIHIVSGIGGKGMTASFGFTKYNIQETLSLNTEKLGNR